jgi:hypothetical protein
MKLYKEITINNLKEIQTEVLKHFPEDGYKRTSVFYLHDNRERFLSIPALREYLESLDLLDHIDTGFGFSITKANADIKIHTDSDLFRYSLNIPLVECNDFHLEFYESIAEPEFLRLNKPQFNTSTSYKHYRQRDCNLVERIEIRQPFVMDTECPHRVVNSSNEHALVLLIRLSHSVDNLIDTMFSAYP